MILSLMKIIKSGITQILVKVRNQSIFNNKTIESKQLKTLSKLILIFSKILANKNFPPHIFKLKNNNSNSNNNITQITRQEDNLNKLKTMMSIIMITSKKLAQISRLLKTLMKYCSNLKEIIKTLL